MKTAILTLTMMLLLSVQSEELHAQHRQIEVEAEPVAYIFDGAGIHGRYLHGSWRYGVEVLGLTIPDGLHGNEGLEARTRAVELHFEHFFTDGPGGFFAGPEAGISNFELTHSESGATEDRIRFSVGFRGGYRWYPGWCDLYLAPVGGLVYSLNAENIEIQGEVFESGPVTPFVTVGIGWSFEL